MEARHLQVILFWWRYHWVMSNSMQCILHRLIYRFQFLLSKCWTGDQKLSWKSEWVTLWKPGNNPMRHNTCAMLLLCCVFVYLFIRQGLIWPFCCCIWWMFALCGESSAFLSHLPLLKIWKLFSTLLHAVKVSLYHWKLPAVTTNAFHVCLSHFMGFLVTIYHTLDLQAYYFGNLIC